MENNNSPPNNSMMNYLEQALLQDSRTTPPIPYYLSSPISQPPPMFSAISQLPYGFSLSTTTTTATQHPLSFQMPSSSDIYPFAPPQLPHHPSSATPLPPFQLAQHMSQLPSPDSVLLVQEQPTTAFPQPLKVLFVLVLSVFVLSLFLVTFVYCLS